MTKKQYHGISEIDYWKDLNDKDAEYLKQFLVDNYQVAFKDMKPTLKDKGVFRKDNARRRDFYHRHAKKGVKDLERTVNIMQGNLDVEDTLQTVALECNLTLMQVRNKIGRENMAPILQDIREIIMNSETNDINIIKVEVKDYLGDLLRRK